MLQNQLLVAVLHVQYKGLGWSEKYHTNWANFAEAREKGQTLASWRANSLAPGCVLVWARASFVDTPINTVALIDRPLKPRAYTGGSSENQGFFSSEPEGPYTALHFRYETADGRWGNRLIRGIGDDVVHALTVQTTDGTLLAWPVGQNLPDQEDTAQAAHTIFRGMLAYVRDNTFYAKKQAGPPVQFDLHPWNRVVYRKVAKRDTGRPFGMTRGRARNKEQGPVIV